MKIMALLLTVGAIQPSLAHSEDIENPPKTTGFKWAMKGAFKSLSASNPLPSQGLPGFLLQGDQGINQSGTQLEHGALQAGYSLNQNLGMQLTIGAHQTDPWHIETALLQMKGGNAHTGWQINAGRQSPSLGPLVNQAGNFDRFGSMPLAKEAMTLGDWTEDGIEVGFKPSFWGLNWHMNAGVWAGHGFPAAANARVFPSLHVGVNGHGMHGNWRADGFIAPIKVTGRGSRITRQQGAHSHAAINCNEPMTDVVCFNGQANLSGISAQWVGEHVPLTLQTAWLLRDEKGTLESNNGLGQYNGNHQGGWLRAMWHIDPSFDTALQLERVQATHHLTGSGTQILASEAGFDNYTPQKRTTLMLAYNALPWAVIHLEVGHEKSQRQSANFVATRLILSVQKAGHH
jgi:hypothetical protein